MKITPINKRNPKDQAYSEMMATNLKALNLPKRPVSKSQCASMQALIDRDPKLDFKQDDVKNRPLPTNWMANPDAKNIDEMVGIRPFDLKEMSHIEAIRRRPKNSIGQSEKSATTPERKEKAVHAFTYSQPTELTEAEKQKITQVTPIEELKELPGKPEKSWLEKFKDWWEVKEIPENKSMIERFSKEEKEAWEFLEKKNEK